MLQQGAKPAPNSTGTLFAQGKSSSPSCSRGEEEAGAGGGVAAGLLRKQKGERIQAPAPRSVSKLLLQPGCPASPAGLPLPDLTSQHTYGGHQRAENMLVSLATLFSLYFSLQGCQKLH